MNNIMNKKDEIIMKLVHYFITVEDYQPIIVNGVKNEVWLENLEAPYKIIRINSNYIHNNEQLKVDNFKIKNITKQIKRKTFSFNLKTLNILLDINDNVDINDVKNIDNYKIKSIKDIRNDNGLGGLFPKLKTMTLGKSNDFETFFNLTTDISNKSEKDNQNYEKIFEPKKLYVNKIIIIINIIMFLLQVFVPSFTDKFLLVPELVKEGEYYRLITSMFLHGGIIHLISNMYALYIVGNQIENLLGKNKYLIIYFFSGITGSLLTSMGSYSSLGASGAIFGLFGALIYFGYHFRLYFGNVILKDIIPVVLVNLLIGFTIPSINNVAHIGGLIGGILSTMAIGVNNNKEKNYLSTGVILSIIYIVFLIILVFIGK